MSVILARSTQATSAIPEGLARSSPGCSATPAIRAPADFPDWSSGSDPVERENECRAINQLLAGVHKRGALVVVEGPPGVGKTRLLSWAEAAAHRCRFRVLAARGDELEQPYRSAC
jgi:predicted ATP-dependent serine protease